MKKQRQDLYDCELLRKFYETKIEPRTDYRIPFEFLYDEELQEIYGSLEFKMFQLRYKLDVFVKKITEFLTL